MSTEKPRKSAGIDERVAVLESRWKWAQRVGGALIGCATALAIYTRDAVTTALERRGEDRVRAAQVIEERELLRLTREELQALRLEVADIHGTVRSLLSRRTGPRTPLPGVN